MHGLRAGRGGRSQQKGGEGAVSWLRRVIEILERKILSLHAEPLLPAVMAVSLCPGATKQCCSQYSEDAKGANIQPHLLAIKAWLLHTCAITEQLNCVSNMLSVMKEL
jgi:hypothetical protein